MKLKTIFAAVFLLTATVHSQAEDNLLSTQEQIMIAAPGVNIIKHDNAPAASFNILIRGMKNLRGTNEPLIILDGAILNPQRMPSVKTFLSEIDDYEIALNTLTMLHEDDIKSIEVLKSAASCAIYGMQGGANGAIIITTKGAKDVNYKVKWRSEVSMSALSKKYDMLNTDNYLKYLAQTNPTSNILGESALKPINWQDEATRLAVSSKHYISLSHKTAGSNLLMSALFEDKNGIMHNSGATDGSLKINFDTKLGENSTFGFNSLLSYSDVDMIQSSSLYGKTGSVQQMLTDMPFDHSVNFLKRSPGNDLIREGYNSWKNDYDDQTKTARVVASLFFDVQLHSFVNWYTQIDVDFINENRRRWRGNGIEEAYNLNGMASISKMDGMKGSAKTEFNYKQYLAKDHLLTASIGADCVTNIWKDNVSEGYNFTLHYKRGLFGATQYPAEDGTLQATPVNNFYSLNHLGYGAYAKVGYSYKGRYEVQGLFRADAMANGYNDQDVFFLPSAEVKWNVHNEAFMESAKDVVSTLAIGGTWGVSGNQTIDTYRNMNYYVPYGVGAYYKELYYGYRSPSYRTVWSQQNDQFDINLSLGFLYDRILLDLSYYNSFSHDKLGVYNLPYKGYATIIPETKSESAVANTGLELGIQALIINNKDFKWDLGLQVATNKNEIISRGFNKDYTGATIGYNAQSKEYMFGHIVKAGESIGSFYGYQTNGIVTAENIASAPSFNGVAPQLGDVLFVDHDGNKNVTEADKTIIGCANPTIYGNLYTNFRYKGWRLGLLFNGSFGNDIMNLNKLYTENYATGNLGNITNDAFNNAYSAANPSGTAPRMDAVGLTEISDRLVENGSYLRLANIELGYDLKFKSKWIQELNFALSADNVFTISKYSGYDPSVNSFGYNPLGMGVDSGAYPAYRTFTLSVGAHF